MNRVCFSLFVIVFSFVIVSPCQSKNTTVYRDSSGKYQGKSVQQGNTTTYRDRTGKYQGKSVRVK